jgi:hypothetical protein
MKRALLVILLILLGAGGIAAWIIFRDTPEKVLRDGLVRLVSARSFGSAVLDVAWTDPSVRVTTGFSAAGRLSLSDIVRPEFLGVIRTGEGVFGKESSGNLIVSQDAIALRPIETDGQVQAKYLSIVGSVTGTPFVLIDRDTFLSRNGYERSIPTGTDEDVRGVLAFAGPVIVPTGGWVKESGRSVSVPFRIERDAARSFLTAFIAAWKGSDPSVEELSRINRLTDDLARGTFWLTVDRSTREPLAVRAAWPFLDERGVERLRLRTRLDLRERNAPVIIGLPAQGIDATARLYPGGSSVLPSAAARSGGLLPIPSSSSGTGLRSGTLDTPTRRLIDEQQTDLFHTYLEELNHRGDTYYP